MPFANPSYQFVKSMFSADCGKISLESQSPLRFLSHSSRGVKSPPQGCSLAGRLRINPITWGTPLNSQPGTARAPAIKNDNTKIPRTNSVNRKTPQAKGKSQTWPYAKKSIKTRASATSNVATCGHRPHLRPKPTTTRSEKYHQAKITKIQYVLKGKSESVT